MKRFFLTFVILGILFLTGCSSEELKKEGMVYQKEYRAAETKIEQKSENYELYNFTYDYPEMYIIYVKYKKVYGDLYTSKAFYVSKDIYESVEVEDSYIYDEHKDSTYPPEKLLVKKEKVEKGEE